MVKIALYITLFVWCFVTGVKLTGITRTARNPDEIPPQPAATSLFAPRGFERPLYRNSTEGSAKWKTGQHNAGCVFYAPDDQCICDEFETPYDLKYRTPDLKT